MNIGKTLFAQLMDLLPWKTFHRIVDRYDGDRYVKSMNCANQFRVMAFAQLTYRESLRDIEVCLSAQSAKLDHTGMRQEVKRSTLAVANETRDWGIHAELAQRLIEGHGNLSWTIAKNAPSVIKRSRVNVIIKVRKEVVANLLKGRGWEEINS